MKKVTLCIACVLFLSGCGSTMYRNADYEKNTQYHMNTDSNYCQSVALGNAPTPQAYVTKAPTTSYGYGTITDQYGNRYNGNYTQTTQPDYMQEAANNFHSIGEQVAAENMQNAIYQRCMAGFGWYVVSE